ncbi:MAG: thiamine ABC transporter substrate-binding protein [Acidimicrobiia bacterium]
MKRLLALAVVITVLPVTAAFATAGAATAAKPATTITLVTHDAFAVSKSVLQRFTARTGVKVKILRAGDAGSALNQMILTKDNPVGDVFFGVDNTFLSRALDNDVFEPYDAAGLASVPSEYQLDPTHHLTPVDHGDVCINTDKKWFAKHDLAVPQTLDDLTKPAYESTLVVENAATSSPGLAFVLASIARYGETGWRDYWQKLRDNGVKVVDDWTAAFEGEFSQGGNKGSYPLVVSYASSPPVAVYFTKPQPATSPIGTMLDSCFQQVEFAGVLAGTEHRDAARQLVDFMLSEQFQADIPLQMFVFPVRDGTPLPPVFEKFAEVAPNPLTLPPAEIGANREKWIEEWTDTTLR